MRPASSEMLTKLSVRAGTEPMIAVAINWGLGALWFASRTMVLPNGANAKGNLVSISSCRCDKRDDNTGTTGGISITLDDSDEALKFVIDNDIVEQAGAIVYLYYEGVSAMLPLLSGRVAGPIAWDEGTRNLELTIEPPIEDEEAGFVPTDEFTDLAESAKNRPWPMIFGKCAHVPAVKVREHTKGILKDTIRLESDVYEFDTDTKDLVIVDTNTLHNDLNETNKINVKDGRKFPQLTPIKISVEGVIFEGSFTGEVFTVTKSNAPKYESLAFAARPVGDFDNQNARVAWLADGEKNIQGLHVYLSTSPDKIWYNYCVKQEGTKCTFKEPFISPITRVWTLISSTHSIDHAAKLTDFGQERPANDFYEMLVRFKGVVATNNSASFKNGLIKRIVDRNKHSEYSWMAPAGAKVIRWDVPDPDIYVVSLVPCLQIHAVYARRKVQMPNGKTEEFFAPISKEYYEIQLESNYEVNGTFVTGLLFYTPLEELKEEGFTDEVYVTATSSVGPNAADIIEWILTTYTDLVLDGGSFNNVAALVTDTPCNFALFEKRNALDLARDIAWQSRCALRFDSVAADIVYLPEEPTYTFSVHEDNTANKTLQYSFTPVDEIYTKLVARWSVSYKNRTNSFTIDAPGLKDKTILATIIDPKDSDEKLAVYRNNIELFGEREKEVEIFIYNEEQYVLNTLNFWGHRLSNCWRHISLETFMPGVVFQPFDGIVLNFTNDVISNINNAPALVEEWSFNPVDNRVTMKVLIPAPSGSFIIDGDFWNA